MIFTWKKLNLSGSLGNLLFCFSFLFFLRWNCFALAWSSARFCYYYCFWNETRCARSAFCWYGVRIWQWNTVHNTSVSISETSNLVMKGFVSHLNYITNLSLERLPVVQSCCWHLLGVVVCSSEDVIWTKMVRLSKKLAKALTVGNR